MSPRVLAADLPGHVGEQVTIAGWLHRRRELKSVTFLVVRDRSGLAQVVLTPGAADGAPSGRAGGPRPAGQTAAAGLPEETVIQVTGLVTANIQAPGGAELTGPVITALSGPA